MTTPRRNVTWRIGAPLASLLLVAAVVTAAPQGAGSITPSDLTDWLTYIASDELEGRALYGTGLGLAARYITDHLRVWGLRPAGDEHSYLQTVRVLGVRTTSHAKVTVESHGEKRTFADGSGVIFPKNLGGKRTLTLDNVEFVGYGLDAPTLDHMDFRGKDVKNEAVVWIGATGPTGADPSVYRRLLAGRNRYATEQLGAAAAVGVQTPGPGRTNAQAPAPRAPMPQTPAPQAARNGAGSRLPTPDFTTVERLDKPLPPTITASDEFFEFLFQHAPAKYDELKRKADAREELPSFRLEDVKITFEVDADYEVVRTQLAQNIVAVIDGSDPSLKDTYVAFGAHYDHVGYAEGELVTDGSTRRRLGAPGRVTPGAEDDRIWNGADDDGSGTVALMALAHAFAGGTHPKRSLLFVWHTGEERGLLGSRFFADYPTVPIDRIVAQLNIDMVGRNRDDLPSESNTVYVVGSDRISTELHEINRAANASLPRPLTLDYSMNDPADLEQLYFRSDHYSYARKGIPIIFFTTGLHADYHANTDEVSKIVFEKLAHITQLIYETGDRVANLDHAPVRDNLGPRAGKGTR